MIECDYCGDSFESDDAYLDHLAADHDGELGRIDRRRVDAHTADEGSGDSTLPYALGAVLVLAVGVVGVVLFLPFGGGSAGQGPSDIGSVHYHGTIEMRVDGERIDFGRDRYQLQADAFHFEGGRGTRWHVHAQGVTLEFAMETLGFDVTPTSLTYEGTTYRDGAPNTTVTVEVDGQAVTPSEYVLREGDQIRIAVERS
jgi:hypothetical protein